MKTRTKMIVIGLVMVTMLLLATGSATARPGVTRFEATAYICGMDDPISQWPSDDGAVLYQRGVIIRSQVESVDEPRMMGVNIDLAHQDITLETQAVQGWGTGTLVTSEGTWYTDWKARSTSEGLASRAFGYGRDGLEGQFFYWEGRQLFPPFEAPVDCPTELALELTGFIRGR
jgi:hypothetical protein